MFPKIGGTVQFLPELSLHSAPLTIPWGLDPKQQQMLSRNFRVDDAAGKYQFPGG